MTNSVWIRRAAFGLTSVFIVILLWAFLTPVAQLPKVTSISDYIWHISIFAVLVIPLSTTLRNQRLKIAIAAVLFGTLIEIIQPYFGRGFEIHDLISNTIGVSAGWLISRPLTRLLK